MMRSSENLAQVEEYWSSNPLGSLETPFPEGSKDFFEWHARIRDYDEGDFCQSMYEFDRHAGEKVLDIGCGNGWLVWNFAQNGAKITGVDLTSVAIELTKKRLAIYDLSADLRIANAESLPFADNSFDYLTSAGVLHHTPDTEKAVSEAIRVLRRGGRGMISFYYLHPLMLPFFWPVTRLFIQLMFRAVPGRSKFGSVKTPDDLVRLYDGNDNPIGKAYTRADMRRMMPNCKIEKFEIHYFPTRFLLGKNAPKIIRIILDRFLGLMIYAKFEKMS
jgi:ubiquinone/menaquinone biosynthesis C-methylase UbiE